MSDPVQEMMITMKAASNTLERKYISQNTKFILNLKRIKGERISGEPPYGFQFINGYIVENQHEMSIINRIYELRSMGCSQRGIIKQITQEGITNRKGKAFGLRSIQNILNNNAH